MNNGLVNMNTTRKPDPLTIEQLRFAMAGDDNTYLRNILTILLRGDLNAFGESAHYFVSNYNDRFHNRLLELAPQKLVFCVDDASPTALQCPYIPYQDDASNIVNTQQVGGIKVGSARSYSTFSSYDVKDSDMEWTHEVALDIARRFVKGGWINTRLPRTPATVENLAVLFAADEYMADPYSLYMNLVKSGWYTQAASSAREMLVTALPSHLDNYKARINHITHEHNVLRTKIHLKNALDSIMGRSL